MPFVGIIRVRLATCVGCGHLGPLGQASLPAWSIRINGHRRLTPHVGAGLSCGETVARMHPRGLDAGTDFPGSHKPEQPRVRKFMPMAFLMPMA